jgi:hypothetical protein
VKDGIEFGLKHIHIHFVRRLKFIKKIFSQFSYIDNDPGERGMSVIAKVIYLNPRVFRRLGKEMIEEA